MSSACLSVAARWLLTATVLLVSQSMVRASDDAGTPAGHPNTSIAMTVPNPDSEQQCDQSHCAKSFRSPHIGMPQFRPPRTIAITSRLVDAVVQNTPGYSDGYPEGVPATYAWCGGSYRPPGNRAPPPDFTAVTGWGQVYPARGSAAYTGQTPVIEIANSQTFVHLKGRSEWTLVQDQARTPLAGAHFVSDFAENHAIEMVNRRGPNGRTAIGAPPVGYNSHFWIYTRGTYDAASVDGVYVQMDMRTIDAQLNVVANVGADWWRDASAAFEDGFANNPGAGMSNWLVLSPRWSTLRFYSASRDAFVAAPPPPLRQHQSIDIPAPIKRRFVARTPCLMTGEMIPQK